MRRALRILYPFVILLGWLVFATPAQAAAGACAGEAPAPESPGSGVAGWFTPNPTGSDIPKDPAGGAWVDGSPIYQNYGSAGLTYHNYDLGCGPDFTNDPAAVIATSLSNWGMEIPKFFTALTGTVLDAAYEPTYLRGLDPMIVSTIDALRGALFNKFAIVVLVGVGILILFGARKMQVSETVTWISWAGLIMILATIFASYPVRIGHAVDAGVGGLLSGVFTTVNQTPETSSPAADVTGTLSNVVLFEEWKLGTFGRADVPDKWVRDIYTAQALTWEEAEIVRKGADAAADPDAEPTPNVLPDGTPMPEGMIENSDPAVNAGTKLLAEKAAQWEATAAEIKESDPEVYEYLKGTKSGARFGGVVIAWFAALLVVPFFLVSGSALVVAYLILRVAFMLAPAIFTIGVAWQARKAVLGVGSAVLAAFINSIWLGVGAAGVALVASVTIAPSAEMHPAVGLLVLGGVAFIIWMFLRPFRRLTTMVNPETAANQAVHAMEYSGRRMGHKGKHLAETAWDSYMGDSDIVERWEREANGDDRMPDVADDRPLDDTQPEPMPDVAQDEPVGSDDEYLDIAQPVTPETATPPPAGDTPCPSCGAYDCAHTARLVA